MILGLTILVGLCFAVALGVGFGLGYVAGSRKATRDVAGRD